VADVWDEVRRDFPALSQWVYLNTAAAGPSPRIVREVVSAFYSEMEDGGDHFWDDWCARREAAREAVARFVGAEPDEVAFMPNTSAGMNAIADLIASDGPVLANELEFPTVTLPWLHRGVPVHRLPAVEGVPRLESFAEPNAPRAATIAVSHVQFSNGCRTDLRALGALKGTRRLVVSASQSAGAFPIDIGAMNVDALACAGHKWLCAGYGAGFVYIARGVLAARAPQSIGWLSVENPFNFDNRHYRLLPSAARLELGCPAFAGIFALGAAVSYLTGLGIEDVAERVLALNMYLTFRLERAGFQVLSPGGEQRSGQTLVALADPGRAVAFLAEHKVLVTPKPQGVRIATHFFNSEADIDACVAALGAYRGTLDVRAGEAAVGGG
jgi:selenocysteine lyase/cysteine desulfurase